MEGGSKEEGYLSKGALGILASTYTRECPPWTPSGIHKPSLSNFGMC